MRSKEQSTGRRFTLRKLYHAFCTLSVLQVKQDKNSAIKVMRRVKIMSKEIEDVRNMLAAGGAS